MFGSSPCLLLSFSFILMWSRSDNTNDFHAAVIGCGPSGQHPGLQSSHSTKAALFNLPDLHPIHVSSHFSRNHRSLVLTSTAKQLCCPRMCLSRSTHQGRHRGLGGGGRMLNNALRCARHNLLPVSQCFCCLATLHRVTCCWVNHAGVALGNVGQQVGQQACYFAAQSSQRMNRCLC